MMNKNKKAEGDENAQFVYSKVLEIVSYVGIAFLMIGYLVYILQLLPLSVPIDTIAGSWHLSAAEMQQKLHTPSGWSFLRNITDLLKGDVVSSMSIYYLATCTIVCLLFAMVVYAREKNYLYTAIIILQVTVLFVAASGVIH